jgi:hypothetical protein
LAARRHAVLGKELPQAKKEARPSARPKEMARLLGMELVKEQEAK